MVPVRICYGLWALDLQHFSYGESPYARIVGRWRLEPGSLLSHQHFNRLAN